MGDFQNCVQKSTTLKLNGLTVRKDADTQPPSMVNSGGRGPFIHRLPPTTLQATRPLLAVMGQPQEISTTSDASAFASRVQRNMCQDWKERNAQKMKPCADLSRRAAPAPLAGNARRRNRPPKKERRQIRWNGKPSQAVAGTIRAGPSQPPTSAAEGPAQHTTQQPVRKDMATAKRVHNETLSTQEERKGPRLDKSKRAANCSYAQAARSNLDVIVTCDRRGLISKEVSEQVLAAIQRKIVVEASFPKQDSPAPTFKARPVFSSGVLKLWCGNDHTLAWLRTLISELPPPTNSSLVVRSQAEIQQRVRCGILIPDEQGIFAESSNIGSALCYQNPWVDIKRWILLHVNKQADAWFVVVGVPEDQIPTLMKAGRRLSFGVGMVYMKFQGPNGRYVDVPQRWDPATETITVTQEEEAAPSTNIAATHADIPAAPAPTAPTAASVGAVLSSGDELELDGNILSSASDLERAGFEGGDERMTSAGVPFVEACPETTPPVTPGNKPWWGADLERKRRIVRAALNRAMNTSAGKDWDAYYTAKRSYKKFIRFRSSARWQKCCGSIESCQQANRNENA